MSWCNTVSARCRPDKNVDGIKKNTLWVNFHFTQLSSLTKTKRLFSKDVKDKAVTLQSFLANSPHLFLCQNPDLVKNILFIHVISPTCEGLLLFKRCCINKLNSLSSSLRQSPCSQTPLFPLVRTPLSETLPPFKQTHLSADQTPPLMPYLLHGFRDIAKGAPVEVK